MLVNFERRRYFPQFGSSAKTPQNYGKCDINHPRSVNKSAIKLLKNCAPISSKTFDGMKNYKAFEGCAIKFEPRTDGLDSISLVRPYIHICRGLFAIMASVNDISQRPLYHPQTTAYKQVRSWITSDGFVRKLSRVVQPDSEERA